MNTVANSNVESGAASLIEALLDHTSSVIYVKDTQYKYMLINRQFEALFHISRQKILGLNDFEVFPKELAEVFRMNDRLVLESGESRQCEEVTLQDDGYHRYFSLKFPLRDDAGIIYAVAGISSDITDRIRDQREIASLQHRQHLILDTVEDGICGLDPAGRILFLNPSAERMLQWTTSDLYGQCHSRIVSNRIQFDGLNQQSSSDAAKGIPSRKLTPVHTATFRRRDGSEVPVEYTIAVTRDHEAIIGAVITFRDTTDRLKQMEMDQELQTARRIQMSLNPRQLPKVPGFDFAALSISCSRACGDYYDFIPWGDHRLAIAVGDVSGHGLGAALEMVETRAILRTLMLSETDPVCCLTKLNEILTDDLPDDMFVTLFLGALNFHDRSLSYAAAGHEALIVDANGIGSRLESTGTALGWNRTASFSNAGTRPLVAGDVLLIATDGIAESISPRRELFGRSRLVELIRQHRLRSSAEILDALYVAVESFRAHVSQRDDITAVVIKVE
ncbi:PP2C family protein-serine/threonine phosphatase [Schlesneria paludicola]|uniref:PP2C family protein-serine/threonine phosphatase n=1 Tax=Schlesneria paludicola TaxID=360056 RepID=UPI00029A16C9|nr:SpoIIE family protein phosphatase [Schlesneria paludicola]